MKDSAIVAPGASLGRLTRGLEKLPKFNNYSPVAIISINAVCRFQESYLDLKCDFFVLLWFYQNFGAILSKRTVFLVLKAFRIPPALRFTTFHSKTFEFLIFLISFFG